MAVDKAKVIQVIKWVMAILGYVVAFLGGTAV